MQIQELVARLLETNEKARQSSLIKKHPHLISLKLAEALKNTYYQSWTSEPRKTRNAANALECLFEKLPLDEVRALKSWVRGIAFLSAGKSEEALGSLEDAAQTFNLLHKPYQAAQTQVSKLYALALLGRYDEAISVGKKAVRIFVKYGDELAAGKIERNIGNIFWRRDSYKKAEKNFLSARKRLLKIKNQEELTMIENCLATVYTSQNNFLEAEKFYSIALARMQGSKMLLTQAEIEASMGNLALFRGRFDEALKFLESSRQKYKSLEMPHQDVVAELEIADVYLELNLLNEAFEIYERVTKRLAALKMQSEEARARANFGRVATTLKKKNLAGRELKKAAKLYLAEKNPVGAATVKLNEASLEFSGRHFQKALKLAEESAGLFAENKNWRRRLTADWLVGEALRNLEMFIEAETILKKTFTEAVKYECPNLVLTTQNSLGKLAMQRCDTRRAEKHFRAAIRLTETLRAPLPAEEFRMAFLANKLDSYEELAKIYLGRNKVEKAFALVEDSRSRVLVEMLGDDLEIWATKDKTANKTLEKSESLREELNWFYSRLNRAGTEELESLQRSARSREKQITKLRRQIGSAGDGTSFQGKTKLDLAKLQAQFGAERALIEYVVFDGQISAFVITDKKIEFVENLCVVSGILPLLEGLRFQFGALRYGAKNLSAFLPELKKRADFYLAELYKKLLAPLENLLKNRALTIIPVRELHYVPFNALFDGQKYTIEKGEVNYAPSATVLQFCLSKPRQKLKNALLVANADERIPLVNREIEHLHQIFRNAKTLTGEKASVSAFIKQAKEFDILHLACHGEFRPDNPLFSSLYLADGAITVRDICSQKLKASLVTLSACETGLNSIFAGDEILGLTRGFLTAGVSSLVLSLWTVNDEATAELMKIFYLRLQTKSVAESLRSAQLRFIENGTHPYFWSPFIVVGRW